MADLDYLKLSKPQKLLHDIGRFFGSLPGRLGGGLKKLGLGIVGVFRGLALDIADLVTTFIHGAWKTSLSYLIMGSGSMARGFT